MSVSSHIARINALTTIARNTWFLLLGVLVFVAIGLFGFEHIDFYGIDRITKVPLVNVDVPTRSFFIVAPTLTAAVYVYFHLYLIRLWDALGAAPPRVEEQRLGDAVSPWLVTDAALNLRTMLREEERCATPRTMEGPAMVLNMLLTWGFGVFVLGWLWWQSMTARDFWPMTAIPAAALLISAFAGGASLAMLVYRMRRAPDDTAVNVFGTAPAMGTLLVAIPAVYLLSIQRTESTDPNLLAPVDLLGEVVVERPDGWLPWDIARRDFKAEWCKREGLDDCSDLGRRANDFEEEWFSRRAVALDALELPNVNPIKNLDVSDDQLLSMERPPELESATNLRGAELRGAFMTRFNLMGAYLQAAKIDGAWLEQANLAYAEMHYAGLRAAQMQGANLFKAQMPDADLVVAQLQNADLFNAHLERADLSRAEMEGANLEFAEMEGARFELAKMRGASLMGAKMEGVDLSRAQMQGVVLVATRMHRVKFDFSLLTGSADDVNVLDSTNLSGATNQGGALRFVDLNKIVFDRETDFRNAFLDGSVNVNMAFREQMGSPCQWSPEPLPDEEFYGRWRGWVESSPGIEINWPEDLKIDGEETLYARPDWKALAPVRWQDVPAIAPPAGCEWTIVPPVIIPVTVVEEQPN